MILTKFNTADLKKFFFTTRFRTTLWYATLFLLLEFMFAVAVYIYMYSNSVEKLDLALKTQAASILRIVKEKQIDLDSFQPDANYQSPDAMVLDMIYDVVVFDRRNYFIQIHQGKKVLFKTVNLKKNTLKPLDNEKEDVSRPFELINSEITDGEIRCYQLVDRRYRVIVAYPKEYIAQTLSGLSDFYIVIFPIFFVIALIGGAVISTKSLSRIDAIIKKTEEITAQRLNEQIPGGEYNDEYGRLVNKMNEMIERIKTSVDFMNHFSISAAHELKTPLTILRGEIEITLKSEKSPAEYVETLKSNYEETIRLIKIIDNLFFISKSDNKLINLERIEIEAKEYVTNVVNSLRLIGKDKGIELMLEIDDNAVICIDNVLMKQALLNIIDNAVKYGAENKPIHIRTTRISQKEFVISVINEGDGIPPEALEKIFERFYRTEASRARKTGGVGLGLSVVNSIVALHGGRVEVASIPNGKTTFSLVLPLC